MSKASMIQICSHVRSGTHYVSKLLHTNLLTGALEYEDLHYSHTRVPSGKFVHVYRRLPAVAKSLWQMRERFGFHRSVTFHDLVTVPLQELPMSESCDVVHNGERVTAVGRMKHAIGLLSQRWSDYVTMFAEMATVNIDYDTAVAYPEQVVCSVAAAYGLSRGPLIPIASRCGWWVSNPEPLEACTDDLAMLEAVADRACEHIRSLSR